MYTVYAQYMYMYMHPHVHAHMIIPFHDPVPAMVDVLQDVLKVGSVVLHVVVGCQATAQLVQDSMFLLEGWDFIKESLQEGQS